MSSSSENLPVKGICSRCLSFWAPEPRTPPPPLHTVYVYTVYLFTQREGVMGEELNQREGLRGNSSQSWVEKNQHDWMYLQFINSDEHLPQSPFTVNFFVDDDILLWCQ